MSEQTTTKIGQRPVAKPVTKMDTLRDTWRVMKPLIKFSFMAMKLLAHALIFIVKSIPKPDDHKPANKGNGKIIKIS